MRERISMKKNNLVFLGILSIIAFAKAQTDESPNIVLILTDDMGIGDISTPQGIELGHHTPSATTHVTPHISALSASGIYFERMYTGSSICGPSRYTMLTGIPTGTKYSVVRGNSKPFRVSPRGELTFVQILQSAGYHTFGTGKFGVGDQKSATKLDTPSDTGFNKFVGYRTHSDAHHYFPRELAEDLNDGNGFKKTTKYTKRNNALRIKNHKDENKQCNIYKTKSGAIKMNTKAAGKGKECEYAPDVLHDISLDWMRESIRTNTTFFNLMATPIAHSGGIDENGKACFNDKGVDCYPIPQVSTPHDVSSLTNNQYINSRASSIMNYLDVQVGEIVTMLKEEGAYENTLIIFTSDNGPAESVITSLSNKKPASRDLLTDTIGAAGPFTGMKRSIGEGGNRMPFLVSWPGVIEPNSIGVTPAMLSDIGPTLFDIIGLEDAGFLHPEPKQFSGKSFLETLLMGNQTDKHRYMTLELCAGTPKNGINTNCDFAYFFGDDLQYKRVCSSGNDLQYPVTAKTRWSKAKKTKGRSGKWTIEDASKCTMGKSGDGYFTISPYTSEEASDRNEFVFNSEIAIEARDYFTEQIKGNGEKYDKPFPNIDLTDVPRLVNV